MAKIIILEHIYNCTDEASMKLQHYLNQVRTKFHMEPEIIRDIELGIIEQLDTILFERNQPIVTLIDVDFIMQKMGDVQMFDTNTDHNYTTYTTRMRKQHLYRDYDNRMIAGVCSGLAAYFNLPVGLVRVIFIVAFFSPLPVVLPYLLMWLLVPPALTKAEKLNMRGIPLNLESIVNIDNYSRNRVFNLAKLILIIIAVLALMLISTILSGLFSLLFF